MILRNNVPSHISRKSHRIRKQPKILKSRTNRHDGKNNYRIDLLVVRKLCEQPVSKNLGRIFSTYNLFEIKGIGSSTGTDAYYKTIEYAGLFIDQTGQKNQYTALDISLTFLSMHYPRNLIKHLTQDRNLIVEKSSPGVYTISKEIFSAQIIVTKELPAEENLYLHCLAQSRPETEVLNRIVADYEAHRDQRLYNRYLYQLTTAYSVRKGENSMLVNEWIFNFFGTSSDEIIEKTQKEDADYYSNLYQPQIDSLFSQNQYLMDLLKKNNIPFETASER